MKVFFARLLVPRRMRRGLLKKKKKKCVKKKKIRVSVKSYQLLIHLIILLCQK